MNLRSKERLIYLSRLSPTRRAKIKAAENEKQNPPCPKSKKATAAAASGKTVKNENSGIRFARLVAKAGLVVEGLDVARAIVWLNQAYQTIIDRSEEITMLPEKEKYTQLATLIQAAIPVNNATPESVSSNLNILRQQIQLKEDDSEILRKLKAHLIKALSEVISNPQAGTPEAGAGGAAPPGGEIGGPPGGGGGGGGATPPPPGGGGGGGGTPGGPPPI